MKITSFKLHDSNFTMVNKFQRLCVEILKKKPKRFRTKLYVFPALQSPLYPEMKPKNKVESQNWKIQTRDMRVSMIFREFRGGGGGARKANKGSCLHSKRGFQLQAPDPWHNLRGQRRGQGEKARHRLLSCSHDDSASWILKKKPSLNCKANQNDTVQLLLLLLHLSLPSFIPFPPRDFFLFLISRDGEISCWILILLVQRAYQCTRERLGNIFPRLWTKRDPNKVRGDCILEFEMFASCFLARGWAERESLLEEISPRFLSRECRGWTGLKVSNWKFEARVVLLGAIP